MSKATEEQLNNPLHGVKLVQILDHLVEQYGWEEMADRIPINCFKSRPTIKSSLRFLRRTEWAREKVQNLYLESIKSKVHSSVPEMWNQFLLANSEYPIKEMPDSWHFGDNEKDAKENAQAVVSYKKQATSASLWWFEENNEPLPKKGDTHIVTDWYGIAKAIIQTVEVNQIPFNQISTEYVKLEGKVDYSLEDWKELQWQFYSDEMELSEEQPKEDMLIVCEHFKTIWSINDIKKAH